MKLSSNEHLYNDPLYISDACIGAGPHVPEVDAPIIYEMNHDPRIIKRFDKPDPEDTVENTAEKIDPSGDNEVYAGLFNPEISYDDAEVLERGLEYYVNTTRYLAGWVALALESPDLYKKIFYWNKVM